MYRKRQFDGDMKSVYRRTA